MKRSQATLTYQDFCSLLQNESDEPSKNDDETKKEVIEEDTAEVVLAETGAGRKWHRRPLHGRRSTYQYCSEGPAADYAGLSSDGSSSKQRFSRRHMSSD